MRKPSARPRQFLNCRGTKTTESECVAELFRRYQALVAGGVK